VTTTIARPQASAIQDGRRCRAVGDNHRFDQWGFPARGRQPPGWNSQYIRTFCDGGPRRSRSSALKRGRHPASEYKAAVIVSTAYRAYRGVGMGNAMWVSHERRDEEISCDHNPGCIAVWLLARLSRSIGPRNASGLSRSKELIHPCPDHIRIGPSKPRSAKFKSCCVNVLGPCWFVHCQGNAAQLFAIPNRWLWGGLIRCEGPETEVNPSRQVHRSVSGPRAPPSRWPADRPDGPYPVRNFAKQPAGTFVGDIVNTGMAASTGLVGRHIKARAFAQIIGVIIGAHSSPRR